MPHTYLGTVAGTKLFEHCQLGDESSLMAKVKGRWIITGFWDMPSVEEMLAWLESVA